MAKINTKILRIETSVARPVELQIFRGENVPIEMHFANYGKPIDLTGYTAEAYYQSPDMTSSWYKDEAEGHLVIDESGEFATWFWTPDIDAGADKYKWFVRVYKDDEDDSYRAFGTIEMLGSPASTPVEPFPPPPIEIDCSKYEWLNYPWLDDAAGSVRGYNLVNGTVTPDKLSEKYLVDNSTDQYSHKVEYSIDTDVKGSCYFDPTADFRGLDTSGNWHDVSLVGVNSVDWPTLAIYRDSLASGNWSAGFRDIFVSIAIDDGEERDVTGLYARLYRDNGVYYLEAYDNQRGYDFSSFALRLTMSLNADSRKLTATILQMRGATEALVGYDLQPTYSVLDTPADIFTDEKLYQGILIPESELALRLADAEVEDGSITTSKLADGAVTSTKLGDFSVTTNKIPVGAVTPEKLSRAYIPKIGEAYGADEVNPLANVHPGTAEPTSSPLQFDLAAENGHTWTLTFESFPMADVVTMYDAGDTGLVNHLTNFGGEEYTIEIEDQDTGETEYQYPVLDWEFSWSNDDLTAEGTGVGLTPAHWWFRFGKVNGVVTLRYVYMILGDSQNTILGTYLDDDSDYVRAAFETTDKAKLGQLVSQLELDANKPEQSDWAQSDSTAVDFIKNKPEVIPVTVDARQKVYTTTTDVQQLAVANSDQSKFAYLFAPQSASDTRTAYIGTNGTVQAAKLQTISGTAPNPLTIPAGADANDAIARTSDLPPFETWTFTLNDNTTVTKKVAIYN